MQGQRFFIFSAYRAVLCVGLCGVLIFLGIFGSLIWRFVFGDGTVFHYQVGELAVHYLDVGQGESTIIQLPSGRIIVKDAGDEMFYSRVRRYLDSRIVPIGGRIDYLIATHAHSDHIGGMVRLLNDFNVGTVFRPHNRILNDPAGASALGSFVGTVAYRNFINTAYSRAENVRFIEAGERIFSAQHDYDFYFHTPTPAFASIADYNNISPIITLRHANHIFVFTGDAGFATEYQFIQSNVDLPFAASRVFLSVGHHGSNGSTGVNFLSKINPDKAIISVGARNAHGHPGIHAVARLYYAGVRGENLMMTSHLGNIAVIINVEGERWFFAFDEEADLRLFLMIALAMVMVGCFVRFRENSQNNI